MRYVFRDFPLAMEPDAPRADRAAHCAGRQGRDWEMHDELFKHQEDLSADALKRRAQAVGLDLSKFAACFDSERLAAVVEQGIADARAAGFRGTPSFVLGPTADGDKVTGLRLIGAQPFAAFRQVIEHELERLAGQGPAGGSEPRR
ncbi:MAG: DsbA family protein [Candidatus Rokubacteria bacterium]|nr:DsbA family protein [Candidatus Rokubacteria bacterium]